MITIIICQMFSFIELYKDWIFYRMAKYNLLVSIRNQEVVN